MSKESRGWKGSLIGTGLLVAVGLCLALLTIAAKPRSSEGNVAVQATLIPTVVIPGMPAHCAPPEGTPPAAEQPTLPTPDTQPPAPAFGLAWFHKPPNDGSTPAQIAEAHRYIHLTGPSDESYREKLWANGFDGPIYTYVTAYAVEGPGPYKNAEAACATGYEPYDNNLAWDEGDFCRYIHGNESWFLHNGAGERIVEDYFGTGRWTYLMNLADPGWRAFSYERFKQIKEEWDYDGIWLDNVDLDLSRALRAAENSDGSVREFSTNAEFQDAMAEWLRGLREELGDYPVWANLVAGRLQPDAWDDYAPHLDGAMDESFGVRWLEGWRTRGEWLAQIERAERWLSSGKGLVMVGQGEKEDNQRLSFTLASYMLVATEGAHFRYTRFDQYYHSLWLYPEYDTARALGPATGPRQQIAPDIWRRPFACGYVEVDLEAHEGRLVLEESGP